LNLSLFTSFSLQIETIPQVENELTPHSKEENNNNGQNMQARFITDRAKYLNF